MRISVSKDSPWDLNAYAKAPMELLLCEVLHPNTKLLWIVLANQANFGPTDKSVLDRRIGIHRSTRIRCMQELKDVGLISGTESHIVMANPIPVLRKLMEEDNRARIEVNEQLLCNSQPELPADVQKTKPKNIKQDYFKIATEAWNAYRPSNYSKINTLSAQLMKSIDLHISALNLQPHSYEEFFSVLKTGIEHSQFWSKDNSSKTLQSIIGIGQPQAKKYQNVYNLYNEGLNYDKGIATNEEERKDEIVINAKYRKLIDDYDELHFMYYSYSINDPDSLGLLTDRIIKIESQLREAGLDPAKFRMKYQLDSWPTDVPEPKESRERFWRYTDDK